MKKTLYDKVNFPENKSPQKYEFHPKVDITAYELAILIPLMINGRSEKNLEEKIKNLSPRIKRHIKECCE
jgi:hypothetical protein